ncbi:MAG TPA: cysteine--tRNA ligase [Chthoniobacterales bacterium]|nr:cysteine--tRNA ligase [Chthoniobacterales bacterium]
MPLRFFNTYSRKIEEFVPRDDHKVGMYTCGPTVYSRAHVGNFRAYIFEDLLQRHLEARGLDVHRVMNITDVDDKTIRGARDAKIPLQEFTQQFKDAFFEDAGTLRIKPADEYPSATDQRYIDKMIAMISALISKGLAYQADDKSVYYRINKFPNYGKLAHIDLAELKPTGRVRNDEYDKEHIGDFALWKAWDADDGDVKWDSPWGPGRPGWHIECSAMATAILGDQIDIHCGGVDNIFPHHEAEIAQSEGVTGKKFVNLWLHCAHLLVDGQKMAKSLGNFYTVPDVLAKGYTGRELRYALMRVHYRTQLNFTWDGMKEARESLERIDEWLLRVQNAAKEKSSSSWAEPVMGDFAAALDDDLNISDALAVLFEQIRESNRLFDSGSVHPLLAKAWLQWWEKINGVLRIEPGEPRVYIMVAETGKFTLSGSLTAEKIPAEVAKLAEERAQARLAKDFRKSDELRDKLNALGWEARDTKDGQKITRRAGAK